MTLVAPLASLATHVPVGPVPTGLPGHVTDDGIATPAVPVAIDEVDDENDDGELDTDDSYKADEDENAEPPGFNDGLDEEDDVDEFDDIDEDDFDDDFDDDFEEELDDDYEIEIDDEISAEFGLNTAGEKTVEEDTSNFDDFEEIE